MRKIDIWTEGIADQKFIADVMAAWFDLYFKQNSTKGKKEIVFEHFSDAYAIQILALGSVSAVTTPAGWEKKKSDFKDNLSYGIKNIVIIDADDDFIAQKSKVNATVTEINFNTERDLYLWPDNCHHDTESNLEVLLEQLVHPNHHDIIECFELYEQCLSSKNRGYLTPDRKAKIYAFANTLTGDGNEKKRDYTDSNHWVLDKTQAPLKTFYDFLKIHLDK